jgi:hypothetical protein
MLERPLFGIHAVELHVQEGRIVLKKSDVGSAS